MSFEAISWACRQSVGKSSTKFVLVALANHADAQGFAWPSIVSICETTEQDRKTVIAALKTLCDAGLLVDTGQKKGGTKQVILYQLQLQNSAENGTVKQHRKRNSTENGTVPKTAGNSTVFPQKQYQKRDTEPSRTIKEPSISIKRPDEVSETAWRDWLKVRKEKKAPLTETAWKAMVREVDKAGWTMADAIAHCAEKSWQGFRADWVAEKPQAERKNGSPPWWISEATIIAKGREIGLNARPGESMDAFKGRINVAIGSHA